MVEAVLFDTNIVIDLLAGVEKAKREVQGHPDRAISLITWIEVMAGVRERDREMTLMFLSAFVVVPVTQAVAEETVSVRQKYKLKLPDAMILATAHVERRKLVTRNTRDFQNGPTVRIPYKL